MPYEHNASNVLPMPRNELNEAMKKILTALAVLVISGACDRTEPKKPNPVKPAPVQKATLEVRKASRVIIPGQIELLLNDGLYVTSKSVATQEDISEAHFTTDTVGTPMLFIRWTPDGRKNLLAAFKDWKGLVAYIVNGRIVAHAQLVMPLDWETIQILLLNPLAEGEREALEALGKK